MDVIALKNLSFTYPNERKKALDNINLTVSSGEFITVCGKSGCGKSTLLKMLKPMLSPNGKREGEIFLFSMSADEADDRFQSEKIGYVMQNPNDQIACDKVWQELVFGLEALGMSTSEMRTKTAEIASYFGIGDLFEKKTSELSGGQKQILSLAAVLIMNPDVIILDEPTGQLDPISAQRFLNTLSEINKKLGITVILSEHRLEDAFALSDRIIVMDTGKIIYDGMPGKICTDRIIHSEMLCAMPTAVRVAASLSVKDICPVTVRDGRKYLSEMITEPIEFVPEKHEALKGKIAIELNDVCFRYEKKSQDIIKNMTLKVTCGEFFTIAGANGVGKTTALSLISGSLKPCSGKIKIGGEDLRKGADFKIALLPQNPQSLFVKNSVIGDLEYTAEKCGSSDLLDYAVGLCELNELLMRHPYDLSGGEQQRAALASILLRKPKIILLDEPTKGLDAHFKIKLAEIIKRLNKEGVTVIAVSHDIEFCAEYADRCAMFFNGAVISCGTPRKFFKNNSYYTTSAAIMAKGYIDNALLTDDIINALGGKTPEIYRQPNITDTLNDENRSVQLNVKESGINDNVRDAEKKTFTAKTAKGIFLLLLSGLAALLLKNRFNGYVEIIYQIATILSAAAGLLCIVPSKNTEIKKRTNGKIRPREIALIAAAMIIIGFTVYFGSIFLHNKKYYFISLLVILEAMAAFFLSFETKKPRIAEVVVISMLCAFGVAGRAAFAATPQFKPVAALVIVSGICLGEEAGFLIGAITAFVSNFIFGQGIWTPWQMFGFGTLGFVSGIASRLGVIGKSKISVTIFGFLTVLFIYGPLLNLSYLVTGTKETGFKLFIYYCLLGLPYDLIHAVSTAFFLWFGANELNEKLERIKVRYGIFE